MYKVVLRTLLLLVATSLFFAGSVFGEDRTIGSLKTVDGAAFIDRAGVTLVATPGLKLQQGDTLRTGSDGSLGAIFRDDTLLSLGPESELTIDEFVFSPGENKMAMVLRMLRGLAAYVSGNMAKLAPDAVRFETPVGTVGVRGTRFVVKIGG